MRSDNILEKLDIIEAFFADNPDITTVSDTLYEITTKINEQLVTKTDFNAYSETM
jgi:hypothetical protein